MDLDDVQSSTVLKFYEAAEEPECWTEALASLSMALDGIALNVWQLDHASGQLTGKADCGYDDDPLSYLYDYDELKQCPLFNKMSQLDKESVYYWNDVISYDGLVNSILWRRWASIIRPKTPTPHTTARVAIEGAISYQLNSAYLTGFRTFEDSERRLWDQLILPHFWQALRLENKLLRTDERRFNSFDVLDRISAAVLLLSDRGLVLEDNQAAGKILEQRDGIGLHRKQLVCAHGDEQRELTGLIAGAGQTGLGKVTGSGGFMTITRPSSKRPYNLAVYPLLEGQKYGSDAKPPRVLVLIDDPEERPEAPAHVLQRVYGTSRAQSRVMVLLLRGLTQEQIADELCLSKNTIKSHEREIFDRLDVRSRSELMKLVLPSMKSLQL